MLKVAICDNEPNIVNQIESILCDYQKRKNAKLRIKIFYEAESLYEYLKKKNCDVIFLDIEFRHMNGVELGRRIREELKDYITKIVYISSKNGYERQLIDVQPLGFIQKPLSYDGIVRMLNKVEVAIRQLKDKTIFSYQKKQIIYRVPIRDILYFESQNHDIKIVTLSEVDEFHDTMTHIMNMLADEKFLQIHRSYFVNFINIKKGSI